MSAPGTRRPPRATRARRSTRGARPGAHVTAVSLQPVRGDHGGDGARLGLLRWALPDGWRAISSAPAGGGIGPCRWVLNVRVSKDYARTDVDVHLRELAAEQRCAGPGVGMLTAADVDLVELADDGGAQVAATVGILHPTWAAAPERATDDPTIPRDGLVRWRRPGTINPGTINVVALVPVPLGDAALVNAVVTITEAKSQALAAAGIPGTGTASDAVCVLCPDGAPDPTDADLAFGGPRSVWGARLARATYAAVHTGSQAWIGRWLPEEAP